MTPERIIWHHTAYAPQVPQFELVNDWHKDRGFPLSSRGYYVGYHWFIEPDGTLKQAREENEIGAHDHGENLNSLGICLAGNFSVNLPNEEQIAAAVLLVSRLRKKWNIKINRIEPHRWDDTTECPGSLLPDNFLVTEYLRRNSDPLLKLTGWLASRYNLL